MPTAGPQLSLELRCVRMPGPVFGDHLQVRLGIQCGAEVIDDVPAIHQDVTFTCKLRVAAGQASSSPPNFLGPYAHGTPGERFIYLCWGERHGAVWTGFRRAKIHLNVLSTVDVLAALAAKRQLVAVITMTDGKSGPRCASIRSDGITWLPLDR